MLPDYFRTVASDRGQALRIGSPFEQSKRKRLVVSLLYENSASPVFDRFGNSAVLRGEDGQAAGHRLEHRVRNSFLISIAAHLAWMKKNMRLIKKFPQLGLRNEAGKKDLFRDAEFSRLPPEFAA
jgi:hypothetical protein